MVAGIKFHRMKKVTTRLLAREVLRLMILRNSLALGLK
jgi:hypothetical protein